MLGKIKGEMRKGWQRMRWFDTSWFEGYELGQTLGDSGRQGGLACCSPWGHRVGHDLVTEQQKILGIYVCAFIVQSLSCVQLLMHQAPLSMGWSGLPFYPPGHVCVCVCVCV